MTYLSTATRLLRGHEGVRGDLYCDKCGKPWKECSLSRVGWLMMRFPCEPERLIAMMPGDGICPGGNPTEGVGFNRYADDIPDPVIDFWLAYRLEHSNEKQVREWLGIARKSEKRGIFLYQTIYYFDLLSPNRKAALLDLAHWAYLEPGSWPNLRARLIAALTAEYQESMHIYYEEAARELLWKDGSDESKGPSRIYKISPTRATELADIIETDELPAWAKEA